MRVFALLVGLFCIVGLGLSLFLSLLAPGEGPLWVDYARYEGRDAGYRFCRYLLATGEHRCEEITYESVARFASPDGAWLAFVDDNRNTNETRLVFRRPFGRRLHVFAPDFVLSPDTMLAWSPDGARVAFTASTLASLVKNVYVVRPDGSGLAQLTDGLDSSLQPAFSPDGETIWYIGYGEDGRTRLHQLSLDDASQNVRFDDAPNAYHPQPTERGVFFVKNCVSNAQRLEPLVECRDNTRRLFYGEGETVTELGAIAQSISLSPDGAWLIFNGPVADERIQVFRTATTAPTSMQPLFSIPAQPQFHATWSPIYGATLYAAMPIALGFGVLVAGGVALWPR